MYLGILNDFDWTIFLGHVKLIFCLASNDEKSNALPFYFQYKTDARVFF